MEAFAIHSPSSSSSSTFSPSSSSSSTFSRISSSLRRRPSPLLSPSQLSPISPLSAQFLKPKPLFLDSHVKLYNSIQPIRASSSSLSLEGEPDKQQQPIISKVAVSVPKNQQGTKIVPVVISVAVGLIIRFLVPKPAQVTTQAWQLLAIFLSTNIGLILNPLPIGAWAFLSLTTTVATKTLTFANAFKGFTNEVIWLIVVSFFFARGFVKTGLGDRIATYFVKWLGKSTLGLSYGLTMGETLVAPSMPSTIARAGGVFLPIIKSTLELTGGKSSNKKLGAFLVQSQLQSAGNSSALFLTAAANNLLCLKLAEEVGVKIPSPWISWFRAASLPAFVSLLVTPFILYKIFPPENEDTLDAPAIATRKLEQMGPVSKNEWVMIGTMLLSVSLWIFGEAVGISSVVTAMLGLSILLLLGVVDWNDCLSEKSAWDTLAWFSVLVGMAGQLTNLGIVTWVSNCVATALQSFSLSWPAAFAVLQATYFLIHYIFASQAAHIGALYSSFLAMHLAAGVPGVLSALTLAYNTSLFGGLNHYSSAQAAAYYGAGYVEVIDCFRLGITMAVINAVIWAGVGSVWWKFLGLY